MKCSHNTPASGVGNSIRVSLAGTAQPAARAGAGGRIHWPPPRVCPPWRPSSCIGVTGINRKVRIAS